MTPAGLNDERIRETIIKAKSAAEQCDWPEALRYWDAVRTHSPHSVQAHLGVAHALREVGRYEEAESTLASAAEHLPDNEAITLARARLAYAREDWELALGRWQDACRRFPNNPWCHLGTVRTLSAIGRRDEIAPLLTAAENALGVAKEHGLETLLALRVELEIARERQDWKAARKAAESIIVHEPVPSAASLLSLARVCWHQGDSEAADDAAHRALAADAKLSEAALVQAWVATNRGDAEAALACYRKLVELNPETVRWWLKLVQLLNRFGRVKEALGHLETIRNRWPNDPMVRKFLRNYGPASGLDQASQCSDVPVDDSDPDNAERQELQAIADKAPAVAYRVRPLIIAHAERDVLIAEVLGTNSVVLVFTGSNDAVSIPLPIFDRYMATLNITTVYLKDFNRLRFLRGIQSLSKDYPGTLAALREMLERLGAQRLCTLGNCDGGFAAIRYGIELGADRVVAFSPPTFNPEDALTRIEEARNFMRKRLAAQVSPDMMDLRPFLESRRHNTQIELFYEEQDPRDRNQALRLNGLPGIRLHPQPERTNHYLLRRFALRSQDFRAMLGSLLGLEA